MLVLIRYPKSYFYHRYVWIQFCIVTKYFPIGNLNKVRKMHERLFYWRTIWVSPAQYSHFFNFKLWMSMKMKLLWSFLVYKITLLYFQKFFLSISVAVRSWFWNIIFHIRRSNYRYPKSIYQELFFPECEGLLCIIAGQTFWTQRRRWDLRPILVKFSAHNSK